MERKVMLRIGRALPESSKRVVRLAWLVGR